MRRSSAALAFLGLVVFLVWPAGIVRSPATAQTFDLFPTPTINSGPQGITSGPDGHIWFAEADANKIGRITVQGVFTEFPIPTAASRPFGIAAGPDGNVWFTEVVGNKIGRITPDGTITEFPIPTASSLPGGIALGPDGNMWFTESNRNKIGRITTFATGSTPVGTITEFPLPTPLNGPFFITRGADNRMWFTENFSNKIGRITTDGVITEFQIPTPDSQPIGIVAAPDGNVWFTESASGKLAKITPGGLITETPANNQSVGITIGPDGFVWAVSQTNKIGKTSLSIDPNVGTFGSITIPVTNATTQFVTLGADGNLWFTINSSAGNNFIGRLASERRFFNTVAASILPSSRSVKVGDVATVFATIINTESTPLTGCGIAPVTPVAGDFSFQTTNPQTNQLTGTLNARVTIPERGLQTFVIAFKANGPYAPTDVQLGFSCSDGQPAPMFVGVNTWLLTFSATPVADMIAVGATPSGFGIALIGGVDQSGVFAISTVNIGAATQLTGRVRFSNPSLPLTGTVCETNPTTAECKQSPAPTVTRTFDHNETATFTVFLKATGTVPGDLANNRVLLEFVDSGGVVRGSTSAAVVTDDQIALPR